MMTTGTATAHSLRSRGRPRNPPSASDRIKELRKEYPKANAEQINELYKTRVRELVVFDDDDIEYEIMRIIDDWLSRHVKDPILRNSTPAETSKKLVKKLAAADQERIETAIKVRLLEYATTYGKKLGDCTGAECARLSRRYGPFFAELAKRLHPSDRVRNHLSERELQAIALTYRLVGPDSVR